jgi:hypothetical protein
MEKKRYYTLEEAERLLPQVEKHLKRLIEVNEDLYAFQTVQIDTKDDMSLLKLNRNFHKLAHEFYVHIIELTKMGIKVRDLNLGAVEFPSKLKNREIVFSWKIGDKNINFWHEAKRNFARDKSVDDIDKSFKDQLSDLR